MALYYDLPVYRDTYQLVLKIFARSQAPAWECGMEALASSHAKLELRPPHSQAGAWERADTGGNLGLYATVVIYGALL